MNAAEGRAIVDAARRTGLPVAEAFMYRFHPVFDSVRAAIARGEIGRPSTLRSVFTFMQDDGAATPASANLGGGSLRDVGCYCVGLSRLLAGTEPLTATAVERRDGVDFTMSGILGFPGGLLAQFECSIENHERHEAEISGTEGTICFPDPWFPGVQSARYLLRRGESEQTIAIPGADHYALEAIDFARAVASGSAPRWPIQDAVANLAAMDALFEAARSGRTVRVAPA
jgi:predicted dehydrogenase